MKHCRNCNQENLDAAICCVMCGASWNGADDVVVSSDAVSHVRVDRPDGSTPMMLGWAALVASLLLFLVSLVSGPAAYEMGPYGSASSVADKLATQWLMQLGSGALFSLFLILWSVGYIVRAISFLPASDA